MNGSILITLVVAGVMAAVVAVAFNYPYLQAKLSILFAGGTVLVLALVQLVREIGLKKVQPDKPAEYGKRTGHGDIAGQYLLEGAWLVGFGTGIYLLGFIIAIPLYICAYMKSHKSSWLASIMTGLIMTASCYGLFTLLLEMRLYPGAIFVHLGLG